MSRSRTALVLFLHPLGVSNTQAIALDLALYFLNLTASLVGAPAFAFGGPKHDAKAKADAAAAGTADPDPGPEAEEVPAA